MQTTEMSPTLRAGIPGSSSPLEPVRIAYLGVLSITIIASMLNPPRPAERIEEREILGDPGLMRQIRAAQADLARGEFDKLLPWDGK